MNTVFLKPKLYDLSQGSRIAFIRQFRTMSRKELSDRLKLHGDNNVKTFWRYEKGKRLPSQSRLEELSKVLDVNIESIKNYNFDSTIDIIYYLLWSEEQFLEFKLKVGELNKYSNYDQKALEKFFIEWDNMKAKLKKGSITYYEYLEWKFKYQI